MKKTPTRNGATSVTFELPAAVSAERAHLAGDFNDWSLESCPMRRRKDGTFAATLRLPPGRYQFRYLVDGQTWVNDWTADAYEPNEFGSDNSVVIV